METEKIEAVQNVLDRVSSYQDGAPEGTVERELRQALGEADLDLTDEQVSSLTEAIERDEGEVSAASVLG